MTQVKRVTELGLEYRPIELSEEGRYRYGVLIKYEKLRKKGLSEKEALEILEVKRSTYYSWRRRYEKSCGPIKKRVTSLNNKSRRPHNVRKSKIITEELITQVYKLREKNPMFGKEKIKRELEKENVYASVSTVGRIITYLQKKNKIANIHKLIGKNRGHRIGAKKRQYAQRIKNQKAQKLGEMIQMDHMVLNLYNGMNVKEFRAVDPITKISISRIYQEATAKNAKIFLKEVIKELEYPIKSIQVDGGSEFMSEFEEYCEEKGIKLYVLPPRSPKMNGIVERTNRTYRYEFWNVYELPENMKDLRKMLRKFEERYNNERMHQSLNYLTPREYYKRIKEKCA